MKRMMSWTPTRSHLMKQMPRKRGPRHKGLESTKWNDEISYLGSDKLMSFWAIFLVLHFASLMCGNPLFGCYKGGTSEVIYIYSGIVALFDPEFPISRYQPPEMMKNNSKSLRSTFSKGIPPQCHRDVGCAVGAVKLQLHSMTFISWDIILPWLYNIV